jgi:hypothetical protein
MRSRLAFQPLILGALLLGLTLTILACQASPRSNRSYDDIRELILGKSGAEVERLLGEPDLRENVLDEQRWIWWNYTFLDGAQYAPEIRRQIVHLEITLKNPTPSDATIPAAQWRVTGPLSVSYSMPSRSH